MDKATRTFGYFAGFPTGEMTHEEEDLAQKIVNSFAKHGSGSTSLKASDLHVSVNDYGLIDVVCRKDVLKAPFHMPMRIKGYLHKSEAEHEDRFWTHFGVDIEELMTSPRRASDVMRKITDKAEDIIRGTGMKIERYRPVEYSKGELTILADIRMIDHGLTEVIARFALQSNHRNDFGYLTREANAQADRIKRKTDGYIVDTIMFNALSTMTDNQVRKLESFLRQEAKKAKFHPPEYRSNELKEQGVTLPASVETISSKDGILTGRIRLSPDITFNRKRLLVGRVLPDSVISTVTGKSLGSVIEHPWLASDIKIERCSIHETGRTALTLKMPMVYFPSGIPVPDESKKG